MALNVSTTVSDIIAAMDALPKEATETQRWTAAVNAIYTRIKADMVVSSIVATGIPVATAGTAAAQTGATNATGTASTSGGGSIT